MTKSITRGLPRNARRVFRGTFFSVHQWRQKLFNGKTAVFEKISRPDATIIVPVTPEGRIVLLRQQQPGTGWFTCLPGGIVEPGESARRSAQRELREETGYRAKKLVPWFVGAPYFRMTSVVHVFIARGCARIGPPHPDGGERITVREVSFAEFLRAASRPGFRHRDITIEALRAQTDTRAMRALRKKLLG
jgi:ADP-ribose pyrophosphatase